MKDLTELESQVYELRHNQGLPHKEICERLGLSYDGSRKSYTRALRKMEVKESPGVGDALDNLGLDSMVVSGGWLKGDGASLRFKMKSEDVEDEVDQFTDLVVTALTERLPKYEPIERPSVSANDLLTKYVLADLHVGLHAYSAETGEGEDYDLKIAERLATEAMEELVASTPNSHTGMLLNLGDMFHANDYSGMTPQSKHLLDMDSRFPKIAVTALRMVRKFIDMMLSKHQKVIIANIPGNHDPDQAHWLAIALKNIYENEPRIEVAWTPSKFFVHEHGKNLIVAHHGDKANFQRLVMASSENFSEAWGRTYWRFLDTGHVHHQREHEIGGMLCRSYRTLTAKDAYAAGSGYTSKRGISAYTLHRDRGEISSNNVNLFRGEVPKSRSA